MPQAVALVTGATGIRDVTDLTLVDADGTEPEPESESESECGGSDPELTDTGSLGLGWIGLGFGFFPCSRSLIGRPFLVLPTCPPS